VQFRVFFGEHVGERSLARSIRSRGGFVDLRGTAVTGLDLAGCISREIASITGHSEKDIDRILKACRGGRIELAGQAMTKLEAHVNRT
jgi:hypothetical protein